MPVVTQNKLTPILVICVVIIAAYVMYAHFSSGEPATVKSGPDLTEVPATTGPKPADEQGGLLGLGSLRASPERTADADSPSETLKTVTASNNEVRQKVQEIIDANTALREENAKLRNNRSDIVQEVMAQVTERIGPAQQGIPAAAGGPTTSRQDAAGAASASTAPSSGGLSELVGAATDGYGPMIKSLGSNGMPSGLGFDSQNGNQAHAPTTTQQTYVRILPVGVKDSKSADGTPTMVDHRGVPLATRSQNTRQNTTASQAASAQAVAPADQQATPFYTIPENATLTRGTLMTSLVGRVPIDGKVQDPMQFKLLIGRENLAANGQKVPDVIAGMVISGIAVGDMALSCSEGLIQSLTFVFDDGSIKTVSMKNDGASIGFGNGTGGTSGGGQTPSVSQSNKLAWISDEYGNPCITGKFVTNAPAYLTDTTLLNTASIAAQAMAISETTTRDSALGSSTSVTGNKNKFIMGQAASSSINEVSNWLMRRLNNSFDAVITPAGGRVVVHFEREIVLDKGPDSKKLEYSENRSRLSARQILD